MKKNPRFAVILSGCGRADGSEIHEAVTALLAIDCQHATYQCFAPSVEQAFVINHLTSEKMETRRNVLVESARIARGNIMPLEELNVKDYDCFLFPGGLGAITNWCDFANHGLECSVNDSVSRVLNQAIEYKKVIGAMCIAPVMLARVLGQYNIKITVGDDDKVIKNIESFGAVHEVKQATEVCVDMKNNIVTTPAYMQAHSIKEVYEGANNMVKAMIELAS